MASGGGFDHTIKLWDVATGIQIRTLKGHTLNVNYVVFSPDGKTIASGSWDATIKLWDVTTGAEICTLTGYIDNVYTDIPSIAFSPDGKTLASGSRDRTIKLWDAATGTEIRILKNCYGSGPVAFSPDSKTLVSRGSDHRIIELWDITTGEYIRALSGHDSGVLSIAFSPDGKTLASGGHYDHVKRIYRILNPTLASEYFDDSIKLWDVVTGAETRTLSGYTGMDRSIAFSPDGKMLAIRRLDSTIKLWDVATGIEFHTLTQHIESIGFSVAFSLDGKMLASGSGRTIRLWDVATGAYMRTLTGHTDFVSPVAFSPDGKTLASGSKDQTIKLWNVAAGTELRTLTGHADSVISVAFSPDGKMLASGGRLDETIKLWDVATGIKIRTLNKVYGTEFNSIAFSPDGKTLASESGRTIRLWDVTNGAEMRTLTGHSLIVTSVTFSPDGKMLASGSLDATIKLWDVATGTELCTLTGHTGIVRPVAFSPDGKTLVSSGSGDHTSKLWDIATGLELASLVSLDDGSWVMVTPDGRFDTNRIDDIKGLHWLMPDALLTPLPIEIFMRDYYEPKLLPRILARQQFKPVRDFSTLNRTQPEVKIVDIAPDSAETVQVTVEVANVKSTVQRNTEGKSLESGVYDVRLFRDRQLVGYAPTNDGEVEVGSIWSRVTSAPAKATLKFPRIKWPRTGVEQVEFSAYAFNADRVKSATDRKTYALTPKPAPIKGRAYVIRLGVNAYEREGLNLRFAANDGRRMDDLAVRLTARGEYQEVVSVPLISDYTVTLADGRTVAAQDVILKKDETLKDFLARNHPIVTENRATKAHLRAVLDVLAGRQADATLLKGIPNADKLRAARPEDLVLISASSHGYTDSDGIFYLVPSDSGTAPLASPEFRSRCVSSDELSRWLRDVDAGELVMIVDACHSAAAVEGTDFKPGPMGSRGLGQLSYDKGMRILTATQADNVALEANKVRQGLLIYALLEDGLASWLADYKPRDKSILLTEWLGYGVERVPRLYEEMKGGRIRGTFDPRELEDGKTQQPSLFDFARRRREVVLARQP